MVINAHAHLGDTVVFDAENFEEPLIASMNGAGIDASIVMPSAGASDAAAVHDRIHAMRLKWPNRIFGMIQYNPHAPDKEIWSEAERCVRKLGFVGIKMHTHASAVNPLGQSARRLATIARHFAIPLMIHTGAGAPWALPSLTIPLAREFDDVPFVLAHAGHSIYAAEAWIAATICDNIYLEPSWCNPSDIATMIAKVGVKRVMFGGDLSINFAAEIAKFRSLDMPAEDLNWCLARTAIELFKLPLTL